MVNQSDRAAVALSHLLDEVLRTRVHHRLVLQRKRADSVDSNKARRAALRALENYVAALNARELPVPPRIQRDLRMLRILCAHAAPRTSP